MAGKKSVKPGVLFAIPLADDAIAVGIVLHVSKTFKNGMIVGVYDRLFDTFDAINLDRLPEQFIMTPNYTSIEMIKKEHWPLIAYCPERLENVVIPRLRSVGSVYYKDEIVERLTSVEDFSRYPTLIGQGKVALEERVRKHFGLLKTNTDREPSARN
jgi:hypothetical protein